MVSVPQIASRIIHVQPLRGWSIWLRACFVPRIASVVIQVQPFQGWRV